MLPEEFRKHLQTRKPFEEPEAKWYNWDARYSKGPHAFADRAQHERHFAPVAYQLAVVAAHHIDRIGNWTDQSNVCLEPGIHV